jgi:hypothetical protein
LGITAIAADRIGQKRPVTIYRPADSLLEGTDMSGKVSTDQLLQLIKWKLIDSAFWAKSDKTG